MDKEKALKYLIIWCIFHVFVLVMSYSEIEIFNDGGRPETEKFWPFVDFAGSYEEFVYDRQPPAGAIFVGNYGHEETQYYFNGIFFNYDWTEFIVYVGGAIAIFFFNFYLNKENTSKK